MSYQFARLETYSSKGNTKRRNVAAICAEAARAPDAAPHVAAPLPPSVLYGVDPMTALSMHDHHIAASKQALRGTGERIRKDTHTLACCVASYHDFTRPAPEGAPSRPTISDRDRRVGYERWKVDAIAFMLADAGRYGRKVLSIVEHLDEDHPHLHSIEIALNGRADCKAAHPGEMAKTAAAKTNPGQKHSATRAFKMAMSSYQDDYFRAVGVKHGQARTGPRRRRLSREAWNAEQREAAAAAVRLEKLRRDQVGAITASLEADRAQHAARATVAAAQKEAAEIIQHAETQAAENVGRLEQIDIHYRALDRGIDALASGEIAGPHPKIRDAFDYAPMPLQERVSLDQEIHPARHRLWLFAKKVTDFIGSKLSEILKREKDLDARETAFAARIEAAKPYLDIAERRALETGSTNGLVP